MLNVSITVQSGQINPKPVSFSFLHILDKSRSKQREKDCCVIDICHSECVYVCEQDTKLNANLPAKFSTFI